MTSTDNRFYVTGGTLAQDAPSYVERQADRDLFEALTRGDFCYVLTARQMGKSSLMVRAAQRLRQEGAAVAVLDLTALGQNLSAEQWYDGLLGHLGVPALQAVLVLGQQALHLGQLALPGEELLAERGHGQAVLVLALAQALLALAEALHLLLHRSHPWLARPTRETTTVVLQLQADAQTSSRSTISVESERRGPSLRIRR